MGKKEISKPITLKAQISGRLPQNQEVTLNADGSGGPVDMGTPFKQTGLGYLAFKTAKHAYDAYQKSKTKHTSEKTPETEGSTGAPEGFISGAGGAGPKGGPTGPKPIVQNTAKAVQVNETPDLTTSKQETTDLPMGSEDPTQGTPFKYNPFGNTSGASMWSNEMSSGRFTQNVSDGAKIAQDISKGSYDMKQENQNMPQHEKSGSGLFSSLLNNMS